MRMMMAAAVRTRLWNENALFPHKGEAETLQQRFENVIREDAQPPFSHLHFHVPVSEVIARSTEAGPVTATGCHHFLWRSFHPQVLAARATQEFSHLQRRAALQEQSHFPTAATDDAQAGSVSLFMA